MDYIKDKRVKIQSFLGGFPAIYKYIIEFVDPQTLEVTIRMSMHCYEQRKRTTMVWLAWKEKPECKFKPRRKFNSRKREFRKPPIWNHPEEL